MLVTIDSNEERVALMRDFCSVANCDREINCDRVARTLVEWMFAKNDVVFIVRLRRV